ncbi:MAG: diacylglycerol kinase family protein [Clostridia bacterium]|nr:diacylglycerol kinase family protein [Clostridia bacterium]
MKTYILYNPIAGNGSCREDVSLLDVLYQNTTHINMRRITNYRTLLSDINQDDRLIICGGDGTLNRFVNSVRGMSLPCKVYYYPIGSGNDFARDLGKEKGSAPDFEINEFITDLPSVYVNGKEYLFINGVGYGIDGYCCEEGDNMRLKRQSVKNNKPINYTMIAIKGLLFHYTPTNATINVDGKEYYFEKVWLAPVMYGRYYGGGMIPAPDQSRISTNGKVSLMVMHGAGKLKTLSIFPSIFKGKHIKHTKYVSVLSGKEITVTFDRPSPLQIDGETIPDVSTYTVRAACKSRSYTVPDCMVI